jgi:hypothetical protein
MFLDNSLMQLHAFMQKSNTLYGNKIWNKIRSAAFFQHSPSIIII